MSLRKQALCRLAVKTPPGAVQLLPSPPILASPRRRTLHPPSTPAPQERPRTFTSSSLSSAFFSRFTGPSRRKWIPGALVANVSYDPAEAFLKAIEAGRPERLHRPYRELVRSLRDRDRASTSTDAALPIRAEDLRAAMKLLSSRCDDGHLLLLQRMFYDVGRLFRWSYEASDFFSLILGYVRAERPDEALVCIAKLKQAYGFRPNIFICNAVLSGFQRKADVAGLERTLAFLEQEGLRPNAISFTSILKGSFAASDLASVERTISAMDAAQVAPTPWTQTTLLNGYSKMECWEKAAEVEQQLQSLLQKGERLDTALWNALIAYKGHRLGVEAAEKELQNALQSADFEPDLFTVNILVSLYGLAYVKDVGSARAALDRVESLTGIRPGREAYSRAISQILRAGSSSPPSGPMGDSVSDEPPVVSPELSARALNDALTLYKDAQSAGVSPDSALVHPIIRALCLKTPPDLDGALSVVEDLPNGSDGRPLVLQPHVYVTLLHAAARARNVNRAIEILDDMRNKGVKLNTRQVIEITLLLMRASRDHVEAFQAYAYLFALDKFALDGAGFMTILSAFTRLRFPRNGRDKQFESAPDSPDSFFSPSSIASYEIAPSEAVFEILRDMTQAGCRPLSNTYTLVLNYYAKVGDEESVLRTHDLIKMDLELEPDLPLVNALMNAYNRTGHFGLVTHIWENLRVNRRRIDNATVSILLDCCGYADELPYARKAWETLRREGFEMNGPNWEAWIECLARCGRLDEAIDVVCSGELRNAGLVVEPKGGESGKIESAPLQDDADAEARQATRSVPDQRTVGMLLRFARFGRKYKDQPEWEDRIMERTKAALPGVWKELRRWRRGGSQVRVKP